ncbi:glutathione S-transferase family protein [Pseudoteredinibacter isoporae]|uniref:Glutathione S-transferase n=1 Tax=Pseudoteredinibacter isoporae TaxID=570281 RepID=A0A7X0JTP5_9GAMM|nr:glutathione S-transferase family protein [Pseudoteredinibacter isoporae]MBB6522069.1 glutathione S-transferase [Pseudoteredinibacter isoporae]NHO87604.1 glutathione S-transferase family protein [Pseudoteredinibacter isoporae]NIB24065.1 glutathione S-transferase family protein [Pseudoteredinibacter isoporae]
MTEHYTLYGSPASLYTGKVRAYLNYKGIPYQEEISSMKVYKKIILPQTGVGMIPVVKTPENEYWQDSSLILDYCEQRFPAKAILPQSPKQKMVALLFELYGDEWLRLPAMHYRWNFPDDNLEFIKGEFGSSVAPGWPKFIQRWLGKKVVEKFSGYVAPLGITEKSIPEIEAWYEEFLGQLNELFSQQDFLLGSCPSLGDFGLMGPLYAHLYRDPYPGKLMRTKAPKVAEWVERMNQSATVEGEFLANDEIPEILERILNRLFKEFWPSLLRSSQNLGKWAADKTPGEAVPRMLGMQDFTIGDVNEQQMSLSYGQWMLQRILQHYQSMSDTEQHQLGAYLANFNEGQNPLDLTISKPVAFNNYRLVLA